MDMCIHDCDIISLLITVYSDTCNTSETDKIPAMCEYIYCVSKISQRTPVTLCSRMERISL